MGDLSGIPQAIMAQHAGRFLSLLDSTQMAKSYKMVLLLAILRRDALPGDITIEELTVAFAVVASRRQFLRNDITAEPAV